MSWYVFLIVSLIVNVLLYMFVKSKKYVRGIKYSILSLALILPLSSFFCVTTINNNIFDDLPLKLFFISYTVSIIMLNEFVKRFMRESELDFNLSILGKPLKISLLIYIFGGFSIIASAVLPVVNKSIANGLFLIRLNETGSGIVVIDLAISLYSLFILENTYRFSQAYQRKTGRLCFLSLLVIIIFQLFFSSYMLLYKSLDERLIFISVAVYGISFPVLLIGLLRYRLGNEYVSIPRNAVFSTISLLLSGAAFFGIGITAFIFNQLNIDFTYFETTLIVVSLCFFAVLVIGSGTMRKRISRFISSNFYSQKFDYREQFFNLHRTFMTGQNVENTLTEIIENMKYTVAVDDAFVFIVNESDGHFYMHENRENSTGSCIVRGDSNIVKELSRNTGSVQLQIFSGGNSGKSADDSAATLRETTRADILFPITGNRVLVGILAIKLGSGIKLDSEDETLIEVFANSIGDVIFKNRLLVELVESKQFESFSHLSSFIVHDIKNQTATLSLLADNAVKNMDNPEFRKSLLVTLRSCTENLKTLVEKLKAPPRSDALKLKRIDINSVIERVIDNTGINTVSSIKFSFNKGQVASCELDEESLFYSIKNIVVNSLDAMNNAGRIDITTGVMEPLPEKLLEMADSGREFFSSYSNYIMVSDTGCGMSREFIEEKLFHPFITTKDKGFGIGLYQCKTLIEKMGGKIICRSEVGRGTDFCILL